ncbi:TetR/AcrR family transcriptional regulator [Paenibacillus glycinis]|uniref:TetR family transcriptional regulator n=1 Tax=Paenibacillus glycinis TaxID=2697035 RepID=A0ABW9XZU8_9BACL|nr:TetR/AcrR family transcriptional regulator [Paenibacillus glycinis]NBD27996.1 TetR family transcriptional regulator [Paenibacillus glycinis]
MVDKKKHSQEISKLILQAARSLFAEHGVEEVSMHQIAKSIQIGQGTLYRRYANKADLCLDLMIETFDGLVEEINRLLESMKELPVKDRLVAVVRHVLAFYHEQLIWLNVIKNSKPSKQDDMYFFDNPCYGKLNKIYCSLLEEAQRKKELIPLTPAFTAHLLLSAILPESLIYNSKVLGYSIDQIADQYCGTFIDPLFKP